MFFNAQQIKTPWAATATHFQPPGKRRLLGVLNSMLRALSESSVSNEFQTSCAHICASTLAWLAAPGFTACSILCPLFRLSGGLHPQSPSIR